MRGVLVHAVTDSLDGPVLVVGEHVGDRWDLAWALHEAGIPAEQMRSADQARIRIAHGRVAGVLITQSTGDGELVDELASRLEPDPVSGQVPFLLVAPRATTPAAVVARVQTLLRANQASWSSEPR